MLCLLVQILNPKYQSLSAGLDRGYAGTGSRCLGVGSSWFEAYAAKCAKTLVVNNIVAREGKAVILV